MGALLQATCPCGYQSRNLFLGSGMLSFMTECLLPARCPACREVVLLDGMQPEGRCPQCGGEASPYFTRLSPGARHGGAQSARLVFNWHTEAGTFAVYDHPYICPRCGEESLRFVDVGCWD